MVSIVIPMYNSESSIERCLRSIMCQSYTDIEIIVIDDGSEDNGKKIVQELLREDNRITYISQHNRGVSNARNHGINVSKGDYLCFIDSDDSIIPEYIQKLTETIESTGADVCICGFREVLTDRSYDWLLTDAEESQLTGEMVTDLYRLRRFINSPCLKLYELQTINQHNIRFNERMVTAEDQEFNYKYYAHCKTVAFVNIAGYIYYRNDLGLSRRRTKQCYENDLSNQEAKTIFMSKWNVRNGDLIIAESVCYFARRYSFLTNEKNTYKKMKERLIKADTLKKPLTLQDKKDNRLYFLVNRKLFFVIYIYMLVRTTIK